MRTTVDVQELASAKRIAAERGVTLSDVVEDALRVFLTREPERKRAKFRPHVVTGELVDPLINLDRTSELLLSDDEQM